MLNKIALIGAASLLSVSLAMAQSSGPSSTAGGAQGTSKSGDLEKPVKTKKAKKTSGSSNESSPSSTAGGAQGTTKGKGAVPGKR
jgi:hypothetical protein